MLAASVNLGLGIIARLARLDFERHPRHHAIMSYYDAMHPETLHDIPIRLMWKFLEVRGLDWHYWQVLRLRIPGFPIIRTIV